MSPLISANGEREDEGHGEALPGRAREFASPFSSQEPPKSVFEIRRGTWKLFFLPPEGRWGVRISAKDQVAMVRNRSSGFRMLECDNGWAGSPPSPTMRPQITPEAPHVAGSGCLGAQHALDRWKPASMAIWVCTLPSLGGMLWRLGPPILIRPPVHPQRAGGSLT